MEQTSIFDHIKKIRRVGRSYEKTAGSFDITNKLRMSMSDAIKDCPLSRAQIAGEMSHLVDAEITKTTIDSWTRLKKSDGSNEPNDRHIPAEWLPAFCKVTGSDEPIMILASKRRLFLMPEPEALEAEIMQEDAYLKKRQQKNNKRKALLKEILDNK